MIYLISSLFTIKSLRGKNSLAKYIWVLFLFSVISGFMVGRQHSMEPTVFFWSLFNCVLLTILFNSFKGYSNLTSSNFSDLNTHRFYNVEKIVLLLSGVALIITSYILYKVAALLLMGLITAEEHKNQGGAVDLFSKIVPHFMLTLSYLLSPVGYMSLSLHFYYMIKKKLIKATVFFIFSFPLLLTGWIALSRSSTVAYLLLYSAILFFLFPLLSRTIKKRIMIGVLLGGVLIGTVFFIISNDRFSERYIKYSQNDAIISETENPLLFSILDYFGQWQEYSPMMMDKYHPKNLFWGIYNSSGIGIQILRYYNRNIDEELDNKLEKIMGHERIMFHGPIARLMFDFGITGTIIFILLFRIFVLKLSPSNHILKTKTIFFLPIILPFPLGFFAGNAFSSIAYELGIIYNLLFYLYVKRNNKITTSICSSS